MVTNSPPTEQSPGTKSGLWMKIGLAVVLLIVVSLSLWVRLLNIGWVMLAGGFLYSISATAVHLAVHTRVLGTQRLEGLHWALLVPVLASHALFLAAFLLQYDMNDVTAGLVIERLFSNESYRLSSFEEMHVWNIGVFVPVCISWILLHRKLRVARMGQ